MRSAVDSMIAVLSICSAVDGFDEMLERRERDVPESGLFQNHLREFRKTKTFSLDTVNCATFFFSINIPGICKTGMRRRFSFI